MQSKWSTACSFSLKLADVTMFCLVLTKSNVNSAALVVRRHQTAHLVSELVASERLQSSVNVNSGHQYPGTPFLPFGHRHLTFSCGRHNKLEL